MNSTLSAKEVRLLRRAQQITTPVINYWTPDDSGISHVVTRGTGFLVRYRGRHFVLTNTHVLERYACLRSHNIRTAIQVLTANGERGVEKHAGYLLAPNAKASVLLGVRSRFNHYDVGIVELTRAGAAAMRRARKFAPENRLDPSPLQVGDMVLYRGYPENSAEFHTSQRALFGYWAEFRTITGSSDGLVIAGSPPAAVIRGTDFQDDGRDLSGISGSALLDTQGHIRAIVWGGHSGISGPIWAVPIGRALELLDEYIQRTPPRSTSARRNRASKAAKS